MKKRPLCSCGSGLAAEHCCETFQIHSFVLPHTESQTRENILQKLKIGSEFQMRNRALAFFYGDDLIAYKLGKPKDPNRNEFLFHLSNYLTDYLEDLSPPSWQECSPIFWEEFISTYLPGRISISKEGHETEKMITEIQKFVRWLDRREGTAWFSIVDHYINMYKSDIKTTETALNALVLHHFPHIHEKDFDFQKDFDADQKRLGVLAQSEDGFFEVQTVIEGVFVLNNLEDGRTYHTKGLPGCILPGILLKGAIGKKKHDLFWSWCATGAVFPKCSKKFLESEEAVIIL
ncbi:hypothetical protein D1B31_02545 [Neobacillus notoginsengisoli]|uniref:SEC-C domain-containing protein n=1 Tax=Neobacillus notoginsengisoli TaxID=1578198 RepID=A0A417Z066_9BACI|nr:hypothetical protein [Neobacillus notoginsengisoli]RHW43550.1 hypothetical protein D1B31_02545 [Neobacillus notoginsengisoli]